MLRNRWKTIRDAISDDIAAGRLQPDDRLPTEPELARLHGAGRHSVRRAISDLARDGKLRVAQGRGTFVEPGTLIEYTIGRRTRLHRNLQGAGRQVTGELLGVERIEADDRLAARLGLAAGAPVLEMRRLTFADGRPIACGAAYRCARRFADFAERRERLGSTTQTYRSYGIEDYLRGETTVHSRVARPEEVRLLQQHPEMPVMVVRATDIEPDGTPLSFSQVTWSAARVKFTFRPDDGDGDRNGGAHG